jgi:hypothetical protein
MAAAKKKRDESVESENSPESDKYQDAEIIESFAKRLIPNFHPEIATANVRYIFRDKAGMKAGRPVRGTVKKVGGIMRYITELDFIVEVALDQWTPMSVQQREALVDHLLERMTGEEDAEDAGAPMKWSVREPDVNEFASILRRHGAWNDDLQTFVGVVSRGVDIPGLVQSVVDSADAN